MYLFQVNVWYPLSIVAGGTTAKIIIGAKDTFVGKYIYKDTLARNLAAVIYRVCFVSVLNTTLLRIQVYISLVTSYLSMS